MAKRSTPKKQQANSQSSRRYKTFQTKTRKRLMASANVGKCSQCNAPKLSHTACPACGYYNGRSVVNKGREMDKITRVKA